MSARRATLERIALRGSWLDEDDVSRLLGLPLPGLDELAAFFEILRMAETSRYDLIVVDTAPTGHTLRLLSMPDTLRAVARVFDDMQAKHRLVVEAIRGRWTPDAEDALIEWIDRNGRELHALLRDRTRARVSWVTLPEPMAVAETADASAALATEDIPLAEIIVNRLVPIRDRPCPCCARRRALEYGAVVDLGRRLPGTALVRVNARVQEPAGVSALAGLGKEIARGARALTEPAKAPRRKWRATIPTATAAAGCIIGEDARLVLFGGKGGVGKTTCAAAASLAIARRARHRDVLLVSTDPAHSLGDAFGCVLSDRARSIPRAPEHLLVREIDAAAAFRNVRAQYASAIDRFFDRLTRGAAALDAGHDRRVMQGLVDLAPPGIDELAAIIEVTAVLESDPDVIVVMDTAPTGHALRLLEMPALVQDWAKALMSMLLKYQPVTGVGELGATLLKLSQGLGRLRARLCDRESTSFIVVTRAASLPRKETTRLVARLHEMRIHVPLALVNAVGRGTCRACRVERAAEEREIDTLRRALPRGVGVALAPAELPPPHGVTALRSWREQWRMR